MIDFPRAWQLCKQSKLKEHDEKCSYRITKRAIICDCHVITKHSEYTSKTFYGENGRVIRKEVSE